METDKVLARAQSKKRSHHSAHEDPAALKSIYEKALSLSPQNSPEEFLQQLELHERLDQLYESNDLTKCMLSAYLFMTRDFRWALLHYMGSSKTPADYVQDETLPPPEVYLRLYKIPPNREGLGDKGFDKIERFLPYFNRVQTPRPLRNRKVKQYDVLELLDKRSICTTRYISEVPFARLVKMVGLRDIVPYKNLCQVPYMLEWGHAEMNLGNPIRKPGRSSGLPDDYWV